MPACVKKHIRANKRVHVLGNVYTHVHGHVFSSALLLDFYLSTPRAAGRSAHQHVCVAIGVLLRPACSACWWLTNGKGHAHEKEVV